MAVDASLTISAFAIDLTKPAEFAIKASKAKKELHAKTRGTNAKITFLKEHIRVLRLHSDGVEVKAGNVNVASLRASRRLIPLIRRGAPAIPVSLIAATVRYRKPAELFDTGEVRRPLRVRIQGERELGFRHHENRSDNFRFLIIRAVDPWARLRN